MAGPLCAESVIAGQRWDRLFLASASAMFVGTFALCISMGFLPSSTHTQQMASQSSSASSPEEMHARWGAVWLLCSLAIVMWLSIQQTGSALALFAESHTEHSFSAFQHSIAGLHGADTGRVSPAWLTGCYVLLSIAELLLGPLGMSLLTQIAPPQRTPQAVGLWFSAAALGNASAGALGLLWGVWPNHRYFGTLALISFGAALTLFLSLPKPERLLDVCD